MNMKSLKERHVTFIEGARAKGANLLKFHCPYCEVEIETIAPPLDEPDTVWDSLSTCVECSKYFFKVTTPTEVEARALSQSKPT